GAGRYEFTLNIDGEKGTCSGEITASGSEDVMCSQGGWDISQTLKGKPGEGGAFSTIEPIPPTDITGITIHEPEAPNTVNITVKRDDKVIVEGEFPFKSRDVENSCGTTTKERNAEIELD